jgi:hypothetical protein
MKPTILWTVVILLSLGLSGCDQGRKSPAKTTISFVHAAPSHPDIIFRRQEAGQATLRYRESTTATVDIDLYNFHLDVTVPGGEPERRVSFDKDVASGTHYTIIATEVAGQLTEVILEHPTADSSAADQQLVVYHAASTVGTVDVYLEPAGTDLISATRRGRLNNSEEFGPINIPVGDYEFVLTEADNPAAVFLRSTPITVTAGQAGIFSIVDATDRGDAPVAVIVSGDASFAFFDQSLNSRVRVINGIADRSTLDFGVDSDFSPPAFPSITFETISDYLTINPGQHSVSASPTGNPSVIEAGVDFSAAAGSLFTFLVAGPTGTSGISFSEDDIRPVTGEAKLSLYNAANLPLFTEVFFTAAGTDLDTIAPSAALGVGAISSNIAFSAAAYELTVRDGSTDTVLAGPTTVTLEAGGFYGVLITDSVGGGTVELTLLDDFN